MKKIIFTFLFLQKVVFGQTDIKKMVDSFQYLKVDTLNINASIYWKTIAKKDKAIPFLIDKLTDTTLTPVKFCCKASRLTVGDISYFALHEIATLPVFLITKIQFDVFVPNDKGDICWSFYNYLFDNKKKLDLQTKLKDWFSKNKSNYHNQIIPLKARTSAQLEYHIDSYYEFTDR